MIIQIKDIFSEYVQEHLLITSLLFSLKKKKNTQGNKAGETNL